MNEIIFYPICGIIIGAAIGELSLFIESLIHKWEFRNWPGGSIKNEALLEYLDD